MCGRQDIFRKYPNKYESIIKTLCENLDTLDEPEAKASMVWIIGEYAGRIKNAPDLLESFVDTFNDENPQVQLQLLTAVVKLFLQRPEDAKEMVTKVLNMATDTSDNPDLRDRGYVYWRLLSTDPEAAQAVVLAQKPVISDDTFQLDPSVLDVLVRCRRLPLAASLPCLCVCVCLCVLCLRCSTLPLPSIHPWAYSVFGVRCVAVCRYRSRTSRRWLRSTTSRLSSS